MKKDLPTHFNLNCNFGSNFQRFVNIPIDQVVDGITLKSKELTLDVLRRKLLNILTEHSLDECPVTWRGVTDYMMCVNLHRADWYQVYFTGEDDAHN